jgi:RNA polymerase sigma-70 factor, ECF subfamily
VAWARLDPEREAAILGLARGSRAEREKAFDEIFQELREAVLALCLHLTGNAADAEDALQETFIALYQGLASFRGESRLTTWIYRITIRVAIRVKARRPRRAGELHDEEAAPHMPDALVAREDSEKLARALAGLSAEHRTVLSLFAIEGLGHAEIAAILGVPEGTVWSRLHSARKKLAAELSIAS